MISNYNIPKWHKKTGIIISILMVLMGVLSMAFPVVSSVVIINAICIAFIIVGIYDIIKYVNMPADYKIGWVLTKGILITIFGIILLFQNYIQTVATFAFIVAIVSIMIGINQLASISLVKKLGRSPGWLIFGGVLSIIVGIFFFIEPLFMNLALIYMVDIYLIVYGIVLFSESASS